MQTFKDVMNSAFDDPDNKWFTPHGNGPTAQKPFTEGSPLEHVGNLAGTNVDLDDGICGTLHVNHLEKYMKLYAVADFQKSLNVVKELQKFWKQLNSPGKVFQALLTSYCIKLAGKGVQRKLWSPILALLIAVHKSGKPLKAVPQEYAA